MSTPITSANRPRVIQALIIDDVAGYVKKDGSFAPGYSAFWYPEYAGLPGGYPQLPKAIQDQLLSATADTNAIKESLLTGLTPEERAEYERIRDTYLTNPENQGDLGTAATELRASSRIRESVKAQIFHALIIDDVAGYGKSGGAFTPGYAAFWYPQYSALPDSYIALSQDVQDQLLSASADTNAIKESLLADLSPEERAEYERIRDEHLTDPAGRCDLYEAIAQFDDTAPVCRSGLAITDLSPRSLKPGEEVTGLRIYGSGLTAVDDGLFVRGPFGDVTVLAIDDCDAAPGMADDTLCTEEFITTNPFQVPTDVTPGRYPVQIIDSSGTILAETSIEIVAEPERVLVTKAAEVSVVPQWVKTWQPDLRLELGYPASVGGEMHPIAAAVADQTPVFGVDLGVRPQFVGPEGMKKTTGVVLDGEVSGRYAVTADGESRGHLTLGVDLSIPAWAKGVIPDLSLDYTYFGQQEDRPNRYFTDESGHRVNFGVGLSRNLGRPWLDGRIYYDLRHDFLSLDLEEHRIGGELTLFKAAQGWKPTIKLDGYGLVGYKEAREMIEAERFGDSTLGIEGGGLRLSAQFNNPTALRIAAGWERLDFATFPAIDSGFLDLAMTFGKAGRFGLNYHYNEFDPYYQSTEQGAALRWTPSWERWDSLTVQLGYDHYTAPRVPNGRGGSSDALDIRVMFDPLKAIWPGYSRREE